MPDTTETSSSDLRQRPQSGGGPPNSFQTTGRDPAGHGWGWPRRLRPQLANHSSLFSAVKFFLWQLWVLPSCARPKRGYCRQAVRAAHQYATLIQ